MCEITANEVASIVGEEPAVELANEANDAIWMFCRALQDRTQDGDASDAHVALSHLAKTANDFAMAVSELPERAWRDLCLNNGKNPGQIAGHFFALDNGWCRCADLGTRPAKQVSFVEQIALVSTTATSINRKRTKPRRGSGRNAVRDGLFIPALADSFERNTGRAAKSWTDEDRGNSPFAEFVNLALRAAGQRPITSKTLSRILKASTQVLSNMRATRSERCAVRESKRARDRIEARF
jgi:hypothetical protein